jgi:hypothetical protein
MIKITLSASPALRLLVNTNIRPLRMKLVLKIKSIRRISRDVKNEEKGEKAATEKHQQKVALKTSVINRLHLTAGS